MKILTLKNRNEVSKKVANLILNEIKKNPKINLGLATGHTVIPLYNDLIKLLKKNKVNLSNIKTFNLDEYIGFKTKNKTSFHYFMKNRFFKNASMKSHNIHFPSKNNFKSYDLLIKDSGGIDLMLLGIGINGHIAFNEPNSKINTKTRIVNLTEETRKSNSKFFKNRKVPEKAITVGISTILKARKIILLATGKNKAEIIAKTLKSPASSSIPATLLKKHKNVLFVIDKDAASKLYSTSIQMRHNRI